MSEARTIEACRADPVTPAPPRLDQLQIASASSLSDWRRIMGNRFVPLQFSVAREHPDFRGTLRSIVVDDTHISDVRASPHRVMHAEDLCVSEPAHRIKLTLVAEGQAVATQDGRTAHLEPGDLAVYDTSRSYTLDFEQETRTVVLVFPLRGLGMSATRIGAFTAVRIPGDSGLASVISPFLLHLGNHLDQLTRVTGARVTRAAIELIASALVAELEGFGPDSPANGALTFERVCEHIDAHLGDPDLCSASIARSQFLSVRALQYLFHREGTTVSNYVRMRRLELCRSDLIDPTHQDLMIFEVASRWGFANAAHFSRLFRAEFGVSPSDYRSAHLRHAPGDWSPSQNS